MGHHVHVQRGGAPQSAGQADDLATEGVDFGRSAGGQVVGPAYVVGGDVPWQREIVVTHGFICEKLGFTIPEADMEAAF